MAEEGHMSSNDHYRELDRAAEAVVKAPEHDRGQAMSRLFALVRELASQEQKQRTRR
jgi:GTP cyclohydrolase FolE2